MIKTVLELDLVGYSTIGDNLEQGLDVTSVAELNKQIQGLVDVGLTAVSASRAQTVMATTGDGAILVFDAAADAYRFAVAVQEATAAHNAPRSQDLAKRVFRIGAATGDIVMEPKAGGGFDIAGGTIARAVRLESKAAPGGVLIDEATYAALPAELKGAFGKSQIVKGKRDEAFTAYPTQPNASGPQDAAYFIALKQEEAESRATTFNFGRDKRREVLRHLDSLKTNQYSRLIFLLGIPIRQRPSEALDLETRLNKIHEWAEENEQLDDLLDILRYLTGASPS